MITMNSMVSGITSIPLISFYSIIDEDVACVKNGILNYKSSAYFDISNLKTKTIHDIVYDLYIRDYINPLYYIKSPIIDYESLDDLYNKMITVFEKETLSHSITTEIYNLLSEFKKSSDISPTILYYSDNQKELLKSLSNTSNINMISIKDAKINPNQWTQFYFRYISELEPFENLQDKTFYFSSCRLNLTDDKKDINLSKERLINLIKNRNKISLYDMYRMDIIERK